MDNLLPDDYALLARKRKRLVKEYLARKELIKTRIAILGGFSTQEILSFTELFLLSRGIKAEFYECSYDRYYEEAIYPSRQLIEFDPQIIYICTSSANISFQALHDEGADQYAIREIRKYQEIWDSLASRFKCPIIQNTFDFPFIRSLGNLDASHPAGKTYLVNTLNLAMAKDARERESLYLCDLQWLAYNAGRDKWANAKEWYANKYAIGVHAIPLLANNIASIIASILGKTKKAIVLDLDNTLWGGVISEDGINNIEIGPGSPTGEAFLEFQSYILDLKRRGIILALASKNDQSIAIEALESSDSLLGKDDFSSIQINWERKDGNIAKIAQELDIGLDSIVFIDDNPAEREIVRQSLSDVVTPDLGSGPEDYIRSIESTGSFETVHISSEDTKRSAMYRQNRLRQRYQVSIGDYSEFLGGLEMKADVISFQEKDLKRLAQLTNKTNQFNLTTLRLTESDLQKMINSEYYVTIQARLADKFGDNGIVSLMAASIDVNEEIANIELWLMSCRVLKRELEDVMMNKMIALLKERHIRIVYGHYIPTSKNKMVESAYLDRGFVATSKGPTDGGGTWFKCEVASYSELPHQIRVNQ